MDRSSKPLPQQAPAGRPRSGAGVGLKPVRAAVAALLVLGLAAGCAGRGGGLRADGRCRAPAFAEAARANALSAASLTINVFGRREAGWAVYAPQTGRVIGTACGLGSEGFAEALAAFQRRARLEPNGRMSEAVLASLKGVWQAERPWVRIRATGACPAGAQGSELEAAAPTDSVDGRPLQIEAQALVAFRRMRRDALRALGPAAADPNVLRAFSAYRSPDADAVRCQVEGSCTGVARAACSDHRTGQALDLDVGAAPGRRLDSSEDDNRLAQTRTPAYLWLVANAARYGFVNYVFEPWHWEYVAEAP